MPNLDRTLLQIYRLLLETEDVYQLLPEILDLVIRGTNAERGQIELYDETGEPRFQKARKGGKDIADQRESKISSKILAWVKANEEIVLSASAKKDDRFRDSTTVLGKNVLSVVCAPLRDEHASSACCTSTIAIAKPCSTMKPKICWASLRTGWPRLYEKGSRSMMNGSVCRASCSTRATASWVISK